MHLTAPSHWSRSIVTNGRDASERVVTIVGMRNYGFFSSGAQKAVGEFLRAHRGVFEVEIPDYCSDKFAILRRN